MCLFLGLADNIWPLTMSKVLRTLTYSGTRASEENVAGEESLSGITFGLRSSLTEISSIEISDLINFVRENLE